MTPYQDTNANNRDDDATSVSPNFQAGLPDPSDPANVSQAGDNSTRDTAAGEAVFGYDYAFVGENDGIEVDDTDQDANGASYTAVGARVGTDEDTTQESEDPDAIRAEIEQTRTDLGDTINAIQEKLNPQVLLDKAKESVHDATIGRVEQMVTNVTDSAKDTGGNIAQMAKDNPVQTALIGLGLGWLLMRNKNSGGSNRQSGYRSPSQSNYAPGYTGDRAYGADYAAYPRSFGQSNSAGMMESIMDKVKENLVPAAIAGLGISWLLRGNSGSDASNKASTRSNSYEGYYDAPSSRQEGGIGDAVGQIQSKVGDVAEQVRDTAGDVAGQVKDAAGTAVHAVGDVAGSVAGKAGDLAGTTGDFGGQLLKTITENPLPAAVTALGIGWLVMQSNAGGQQRLRQAGEVVGDIAGQATDTVGDTVGAVGDTLKDGAQQTQRGFNRMLMENPLAVGVMTVAAGALIGMALPETNQEHQLMGAMRDKLVERAQSVAQTTLDKVQQTTGDVMQQIQDKATEVQSDVEDRVADMGTGEVQY